MVKSLLYLNSVAPSYRWWLASHSSKRCRFISSTATVAAKASEIQNLRLIVLALLFPNGRQFVLTWAQMSMEQYSFGPYKIDAKEVFYSTSLSYAMVNLRPLFPGTSFYLSCSFFRLSYIQSFYVCLHKMCTPTVWYIDWVKDMYDGTVTNMRGFKMSSHIWL